MPKVTYIDHDGTTHVVDVPEGETVMQGAVNSNLSGIAAECGGGMACATCHCYVDDAWADKIPASTELEDELLEAAAAERKPTSRLSCQITVTGALDGMVIHLPEKQF